MVKDYKKRFPINREFKVPHICLGLGLVSCIVSCKQEENRHEERPNILFIVTDDQGPWTLSSQSYPNAYTPNLDKLADKGVVMKNAFAVSAVCSPSRAALISGRYPSETGVLTYLNQANLTGVDTSLVLWPELFSDAGYKTAMVGKWHIGHANEFHHPEQRGFQRFSGFLRGAGISRDPVVRIEGQDTTFRGEYTPDVLTNLAMNYIREFDNNPWIISLHYFAPHAVGRFPDDFQPDERGRSWLPLKDEDLEYWKEIDLVLPDPDFPNLDIELLERKLREYHASVHSVDRNVGRLMQFLEDLNLYKNTIVIFTSDHGYMMGHHGLWHKGNGMWLTRDKMDPCSKYSSNIRPNLFDLSLQVPCIIQWPGKVEAGTVIEETITFLDFFPTLLDMANIKKPDNLLLRGNSFVPLLRGYEVPWDNTFLAQMSLSDSRLRCIRTPEWKYIYEFEDTTKNEFYNLIDDPGEFINLINSTEPAIIIEREKMKAILFTKLIEIKDPIMIVD